MAKIATAHIEIKPVLNEEALQGVLDAIEQAVSLGFRRGVDAAERGIAVRYGDAGERARDEVVDILNAHGHNLKK